MAKKAEELSKADQKRLAKAFEITLKDSEHARVMLKVAMLETELRSLLELNMPGLSKTLSEDLFDKGALQNIGPRTQVARALGLIGAPLAAELRKLKEIRNKFAHSPKTKSLADDPVVSLLVEKLDRRGLPAGSAHRTIFSHACKLAAMEIMGRMLIHGGKKPDDQASAS